MITSTNDDGSMPSTSGPLRVGPSAFSAGGQVHLRRYGSGAIALEVVDDAGEPQYVATVNLIRYGGPDPGEYGMWLKGWSENEGVPRALVDAGIVTLSGRRHPAGFAEAEHAELTERARAVLLAKRGCMTVAAHREVDALKDLGLVTPEQAAQLKRLLTSEAIEQHDQNGMSIREIVDMYRDLTKPS